MNDISPHAGILRQLSVTLSPLSMINDSLTSDYQSALGSDFESASLCGDKKVNPLGIFAPLGQGRDSEADQAFR